MFWFFSMIFSAVFTAVYDIVYTCLSGALGLTAAV